MKKISLCLVALTIAMVSCEPNIEKPIAVAPTVLTESVTEITESTADVVGQVAADGGTEVTERGVCWNTDGAPTILDYRVKDTAVGQGTFTSKLSDLKANTTYYVRAYATNAVGTSYGEEKSFTTKEKVNTDTPDRPEGVISCAEALAICKATGTTSTTETYTIRGYVTEFKETFNTQYGDVTYWMADEQGGGKVLLAYRVKPVKTNDQAVKVNDYVEVVGTLVNYNGNTPEVNPAGTYTIIPEQPVDKNQIIKFQDDNAKLICILHWDENEDGELSLGEADAVTTLGTAFKDSRILAFNELKYFTGLASVADSDFEGCISLVKITLPERIITIGASAFRNCTNLKKIVIPDRVTSIGEYAFNGCSGLTSVTIGNSVTSIGKYAFYGCTGELIVNCNIPSSLDYSDYGAFYASEFTKATIGDGVTTIGDCAFYRCRSLTSITIPDSVTSIEDYAFYSCSSLASITIPDSVTSIGYYAFEDCSSLASITIPDSVTSIGGYVFNGCISLTSITIPDSVTKIGQDLFRSCVSLTAFYGKFASADNRCLIIDGELNSFAPAGLTEYTIPDGVTVISNKVFAGLDYLTSVTIPNSVTEIRYGAFYECDSLTRVYCKSTTPPTGGYYIFSTYNKGDYVPIGCFIYVPTASVEAYKAAKIWSDYAKYIKGYNF